MPTEVRQTQGRAVSHRGVPEAVQVGGRATPDDLAEPPDDLPADAKDLWRRDVATLVEVGIVDRVDRAALEGLCIAYARAKQAGRVVKSEGFFTGGSRGQLREHPAVKIERESWRMFLTLAEQYALTPVARTRLGMAELGRRTLQADLHERLGAPSFEPVIDGSVAD